MEKRTVPAELAAKLAREAAEMETEDLAKHEYGQSAQIAIVCTRRTRNPWQAEVIALDKTGSFPEKTAVSSGTGMVEALANLRRLLVEMYCKPREYRNW